jgi:hypothetical protein
VKTLYTDHFVLPATRACSRSPSTVHATSRSGKNPRPGHRADGAGDDDREALVLDAFGGAGSPVVVAMGDGYGRRIEDTAGVNGQTVAVAASAAPPATSTSR